LSFCIKFLIHDFEGGCESNFKVNVSNFIGQIAFFELFLQRNRQ